VLGLIVNWFILILILLSTLAVILESISGISKTFNIHFRVFNTITIVIFSIEYLLRLWSSPVDKKYSGRFGRIKYALSFMAIVDLLAILPFYLPLIVPIDLRFIRTLRMMRLFRLVKLVRYSNAIQDYIQVINRRKEHLIIIISTILVFLVLISGVMFIVEHEAQPLKFKDIPETMWWAVCTMTTVGYGDIYPITTLGKLLSGIISILGIGLFAIPAGILSSGFVEVLQERRKKNIEKCPHCGKRIDDSIKIME
jgi:voltage-gated potassium channel